MAHVHCGADQGICFRIAGELCPNGYDIQPVMSGSEGNFLVRCHGARLPPVVAAAPSAVAPPAGWASAHTPPAPSSGSGEHWPPANEPWPNAYPWPPPETSAATQPPAPNAPSAAGTKAEINLGF
ncbi:MAG TPA: hypothetical protein VHB79_24580 [Polyangiaceae bacterium]|nr:hypothetical protein [Polyangiaceae bacterium]